MTGMVDRVYSYTHSLNNPEIITSVNRTFILNYYLFSIFAVSKLTEATVHLAQEIAPHIRKKGGEIVPKSLTKENASGKSKLDGAVEVAASGLQG